MMLILFTNTLQNLTQGGVIYIVLGVFEAPMRAKI